MNNILPVTIGVRLSPEALGLVEHLSARTDEMWRDETMMPKAIAIEVHTIKSQDEELERTLYFGKFCLNSYEQPVHGTAEAQMIGFAKSDTSRRFMGMLLGTKASLTHSKDGEVIEREILTLFDRQGPKKGLKPNTVPIQRVKGLVFDRDRKAPYSEFLATAKNYLPSIANR